MQRFTFILYVFLFLQNCAGFFSKEGSVLKDPTVPSKKLEAPGDYETCFSPDQQCDEKLIKFIASADDSIDIAIYEITLESIADEIINKSKTLEKKKIRIIVDPRKAKGPHSLVPMLQSAGLFIHGGKRGVEMHNKFVIIDGKTVETGSFNFSGNAANKNYENQVYLFSPDIVGKFKDRFEKIWNETESLKL